MAVILTDYENYGKKTFYVLWFNIRDEYNICNVFSYGSISLEVVVDIAQKGEWDRLISSVVIIVITGVIVLLGYRFACIRYNVEAKRIYGKLYEQVLSHEMKLPCEYYENHHSGEMLSKVSFDLGRMGDIFGSRFRRVVMPFMMVVVFLVPMFALSWQLTLCLVAVNTVLIGVTMVLTGPLKSLSKKMSESNSIMTKHITDLIQGIIQVRMFEAGRKTVDRYNEEADVYAVKSDKRNMFSSLLECANTGFDLICNLVFLALGILFVQKGYTTLVLLRRYIQCMDVFQDNSCKWESIFRSLLRI